MLDHHVYDVTRRASSWRCAAASDGDVRSVERLICSQCAECADPACQLVERVMLLHSNNTTHGLHTANLASRPTTQCYRCRSILKIS